MATGFDVQDVLGNVVHVTEAAWRYVIRGHPDMVGKETLVKDAIAHPDTVYRRGAERQRLTFSSRNVQMGGHQGYTRAVVEYDTSQPEAGNGTGHLVTAYLSRRTFKGMVVWQKP